MFFVASKLLDLALSPLIWAMLLALPLLVSRGLERLPRLARAARPLAALSLAVLYVASTGLVPTALWKHLERGVEATMRDGDPYDVVVVLGGMLSEEATLQHHRPSYNDNVERILATRDLLVAGKVRLALISGGDGSLSARARAPEAALLRDQLVDWGIDAARIIIEPDSRNTHENATNTARILRAQGLSRVLLVTSAFHMPRAVGCFRAQGIDVDTYPVDHRTLAGWALSAEDFLPRAGNLARTEAALREDAGRLIYRLRGYAR